MDWQRLLFSPAGALDQRGFGIGLIVTYGAYMLSHALLGGPIVKAVWIVPYAAAQFLCLWWWYALHAKRLRDGGKPSWPALVVGLILLCALLVILVLIGIFVSLAGTGQEADNYNAALSFYVLIALGAVLLGVVDPSGITPIVIALLVLMAGPALFSLPLTIWAATRRRAYPPPPPYYGAYPPANWR